MIKQVGGLFKEISQEVVDKWENPHAKQRDCCPCVFNMLGIINDTEMTQLVQEYGEKGMFQENIMGFFSDKYTDYKFSFAEAKLKGASSAQIRDTIIAMYKYIPKGYGMIGAIERENGSGHCVVYSRDKNNKPCIFDSQFKKTYMSGEQLKAFFVGNRVHTIFFLQSKHKKDKQSLKIDEEGLLEVFHDAPDKPNSRDVFFDAIDGKTLGKSKKRKKRKSRKQKSLKKARILTKKEYNKLIKKRKSKKKLTKRENKRLDHTLFIKYCKCVKNLKYSKKKKDYSKKKKDYSEYPICTSAVYKKRGFKTPTDVKKRCKKYR